MNKSVIIILSVTWAICAVYLALSKFYDYPYSHLAMAASWISTALLLICILIYIKKHKGKAD